MVVQRKTYLDKPSVRNTTVLLRSLPEFAVAENLICCLIFSRNIFSRRVWDKNHIIEIAFDAFDKTTSCEKTLNVLMPYMNRTVLGW